MMFHHSCCQNQQVVLFFHAWLCDLSCLYLVVSLVVWHGNLKAGETSNHEQTGCGWSRFWTPKETEELWVCQVPFGIRVLEVHTSWHALIHMPIHTVYIYTTMSCWWNLMVHSFPRGVWTWICPAVLAPLQVPIQKRIEKFVSVALPLSRPFRETYEAGNGWSAASGSLEMRPHWLSDLSMRCFNTCTVGVGDLVSKNMQKPKGLWGGDSVVTMGFGCARTRCC